MNSKSEQYLQEQEQLLEDLQCKSDSMYVKESENAKRDRLDDLIQLLLNNNIHPDDTLLKELHDVFGAEMFKPKVSERKSIPKILLIHEDSDSEDECNNENDKDIDVKSKVININISL